MKSRTNKRMFAALLAATLFCGTPLHVWAEGSDEHGYTVTEEEKQAKEKLDVAEDEYAEAQALEEATSDAKDAANNEAAAAIKAAEEAAKAADDAKTAAETELNAVKTQAKEKADAAKKEADEAQQAYDNAVQASEAADKEMNAARTAYDDAQKKLDDLKKENPNAAEELANAKSAADQANNAYESAKQASEEADRAAADALTVLNEKTTALEEANAALATATADNDAKQKALADAQADYDDKAAIYDEAVKNAENDPEVAAAKAEADTAKKELDQAKAEKQKTADNVTAKQGELTAAKQTLSDKQTALTAAEADAKTAQEAADLADQNHADAEKALTAAEEKTAAAQKTADAVKDAVTAAETDKAAKDKAVTDAKTAVSDAEKAVSDAEKAQKDAQDAYDNIKDPEEEGIKGFFAWLSTNTEVSQAVRDDAATAVKILEGNDSGWKNTGNFGTPKVNTIAEMLANSTDMNTLSYLKESLDFIDEGNNLRVADDQNPGLKPLTVSSQLMAMAMVNVNWSSLHWGHSLHFAVLENLATASYKNDPYDGWYTEEKEAYVNHTGGVTGHYTTLIDLNGMKSVSTGFAIVKNGEYTYQGFTMNYCQSQTFTDRVIAGALSVSDYRALVDKYMSAKEDAKKALDDANTALADAKKDLDSKKTALSNAEKEAESAATALENAKKDQTTADNALTEAKKEQTAAEEKETETKTAADSAYAALTEKQNALTAAQGEANNAKAAVEEAESALATAEVEDQAAADAVTEAQKNADAADQKVADAVAKVDGDIKQKLADKEVAQKTLTDAQSAADTAKKNLDSAESAAQTAQTEKDNAEQTSNTAATTAAEKKTALDKAEADKDAADKKLAEVTEKNKALSDAEADAAAKKQTYEEKKTASEQAASTVTEAKKALDEKKSAQDQADAEKKAADAITLDDVLSGRVSDEYPTLQTVGKTYQQAEETAGIKEAQKDAAVQIADEARAAYEAAHKTLIEKSDALDKANEAYLALVVTDMKATSNPTAFTIGDHYEAKYLTVVLTHANGKTETLGSSDVDVKAVDLSSVALESVINNKSEPRTVKATTKYGDVSVDITVAPKVYEMLEGANSQATQGSLKDMKFRSSAEYDVFAEKVLVDGKEISQDSYTSSEGSTVVVLKEAYLKTLSVGTHELRIISNDGFAKTTFTINAASKPSTDGKVPNTSDSNNNGLWITALVVALLAGAGAFFLRRKA